MPAPHETIWIRDQMGMQSIERREFFRWEVLRPCRVRIGGTEQEAVLMDISGQGARLQGDFEKNPAGQLVRLVAPLKDQEELAFQALYCETQETETVSCGLKFSEGTIDRERLMKYLDQGIGRAESPWRDLEQFFEYLASREPSLRSWSSEVSTDEVVSAFSKLENGNPLQPPPAFLLQLKSIVDEEWRIAISVILRWTQNRGESYTEQEGEEIAQGLLWGTLLIGQLQVS